MSSFSIMYLVASMFFIYIETTTSDIVRRQLTKHQVEFDFHNREDFPDILPVVIKSTDRTVNFSFTKKDVNYNVPVYIRSKDTNEVILMETSQITDAAFYEDRMYDASVTLYCKEHDFSSHLRNPCNIQSLSGFFHLDGYKHVIEPEKKVSKRIILQASQNPKNKFVQKHRVYKLVGHNHSCNVKESLQSVKSIINRTVIHGNNRFKRSKIKYTIEVIALVTLEPNEEEMKRTKIYYTHVFWEVNLLYNNINTNDMFIEVKLIGIHLEPTNTTLYKFPKGSKEDYLNGTLSLNTLAKHPVVNNADHLVMFSIHNISDNPSTVGLANVGAMCKKGSVSLCRVLRSFEEIHVVAHEIGHSLNSLHDGEQNTCSESSGYIMTAITIIKPSRQQTLNSYKFSECSIRAIKSYILNLNPNNCLLSPLSPGIMPSIPTGQLFSPREQCKTSPRSSGICSSIYTRNNADICLSLPCRKDKNLCKSVIPAHKTTCGNQKWCIYGQCVFDEKAPKADENCLFGDDENVNFNIRYPGGINYQPKNCTDIINRLPDFCTKPIQRMFCCYSCKQLENPQTATTPSSSSSSSSLSPWSVSVWPLSSTLSSSMLSSSTLSSSTLSSSTLSSSTLSSSTIAASPEAAKNIQSQLFPIVLVLLHLFQPESIITL